MLESFSEYEIQPAWRMLARGELLPTQNLWKSFSILQAPSVLSQWQQLARMNETRWEGTRPRSARIQHSLCRTQIKATVMTLVASRFTIALTTSIYHREVISVSQRRDAKEDLRQKASKQVLSIVPEKWHPFFSVSRYFVWLTIENHVRALFRRCVF